MNDLLLLSTGALSALSPILIVAASYVLKSERERTDTKLDSILKELEHIKKTEGETKNKVEKIENRISFLEARKKRPITKNNHAV